MAIKPGQRVRSIFDKHNRIGVIVRTFGGAGKANVVVRYDDGSEKTYPTEQIEVVNG